MKLYEPKVSIITVVYNDINSIEKTIQSVINQTYFNIEYVIIDGGSNDGTLEIIKKYQDKIAFWISEKDQGIYYAMNKGTEIATGSWINFLNSGDWLYCNNTIEKVFKNRNLKNIEVIYGNTEKRKDKKSEVHVPSKQNKFWKNLVVHQSIFSRIELNKKYPFDTSFKVSSDFDFIFKVFFYKHEAEYIDVTITSFDLIGYSHHNRYVGFAEDRKICLKYEGNNILKFQVYTHYIKIHLVGKIIDFLKSYMPFLYKALKRIKK